jgi:cadmium resistance protein CadD (predicted permease)
VNHALVTVLSGVWPFMVTNVDDFVLLTVLFATAGRGGPSGRQIVVGQYLGIGVLVAVSSLVALGLAPVPERWVGLLGLVPVGLGVRGLLRPRHDLADDRRVGVATGTAGVVALTVANGADNLSVYIPLFREAGVAGTTVYVVTFAVLVGLWCAVARALAGRRVLVAGIDRVGHWLVPLLYIAIGIRVMVASGLFG